MGRLESKGTAFQVIEDAQRLRELQIIDDRQFREIVAWVLSWEVHRTLEPCLDRYQQHLLDFTEQIGSSLMETLHTGARHA